MIQKLKFLSLNNECVKFNKAMINRIVCSLKPFNNSAEFCSRFCCWIPVKHLLSECKDR